MKIIPILSLSALLLISCRQEKPVVKPNVDLFFQVYEALIDMQSTDSTVVLDRSTLLDSALRRCGMSAEQFDTTLAYLAAHPQVLVDRLEGMEKKPKAADSQN